MPSFFTKDRQDKITMETKVQFTNGKVNLRGIIINRKSRKRRIMSFILKENIRFR